MRVFVALEIPDPLVIDKLVEVQRELASTGADLKPVERENIHFTIRFLGEISEDQASSADSNLKGLKLAPPLVEVRGVGAFPSPSRPRTIWVGVSEASELSLKPVAESVTRALEGIGEKDDRPFKAHATLARVRSAHRVEALSQVLSKESRTEFGKVAPASLKLKKSVLGPSGPTYSDIGVYPFG
jgi:RNA 2',3'-cyclic 3'-phosphodiesterase